MKYSHKKKTKNTSLETFNISKLTKYLFGFKKNHRSTIQYLEIVSLIQVLGYRDRISNSFVIQIVDTGNWDAGASWVREFDSADGISFAYFAGK